MNDKLDISLSEKENSIHNKSFYSTDFNFPDLVEYQIFQDENPIEIMTKLKM